MTAEELDMLLATAKPFSTGGARDMWFWSNPSPYTRTYPPECKLPEPLFSMTARQAEDGFFETEAAAMDALRAAVAKYKQTAPAAQPEGR